MSKRTVIYFFILSFFSCIGCNSLQRVNNNDPSNPYYGPPPIPTSFTSNAGNSSVVLSWTAVKVADLAGYNIYRSITSGAGFLKINSSTITTITYSDSSLTNNTTYYYKITSIDNSGNESGYSDEISAMPVPDITAPSAPSSLRTSVGDGSVLLSWTANSESDLSGYNIYRSVSSSTGFSKINLSVLTSASYTDSGLTNGTIYYYKITAIDTSSNESSFSAVVSGKPASAPDTTAPSTPTGLLATKGDGQVILSWDANSESDIAGYDVYGDTSPWSDITAVKINASLITSTNYTVKGLKNGTAYLFKIRAVDASGNASTKSSSVSCTPADTTPPAAPTGLTAVTSYTYYDQIDLSWYLNTEPDFSYYNVYRSTSSSGPFGLISSVRYGRTYSDTTGLSYPTNYYYKVTAVDTAGNESSFSTVVSSKSHL